MAGRPLSCGNARLWGKAVAPLLLPKLFYNCSTTFIYIIFLNDCMSFSQSIKDFSRLRQILSVLVRYEFGFLISKFNLTKHLPLQKRLDKKGFKNEQANPVKIKAVFEELGGTFIKLGQLLSLRPDLIPKEYCEEFKISIQVVSCNTQAYKDCNCPQSKICTFR